MINNCEVSCLSYSLGGWLGLENKLYLDKEMEDNFCDLREAWKRFGCYPDSFEES